MSDGSKWFAPEPAQLPGSRLVLDLGLRSTDQTLRELVVPGIGRVWFVRQLSWAVAAIVLRDELRKQRDRSVRATTISHALEALGCKLAWHDDYDAPRVMGKRAFARDDGDEGIWSFSQLSHRRHYVRNTYRQTTSRALVELGLATGNRYERFELEPIGEALADEFLTQKVGKGSAKLSDRLMEWIQGERQVEWDHPSWLRALSPNHPSEAERDRTRKRLLDQEPGEASKRKDLASAFRGRKTTPTVDDIREAIIPRLHDRKHAHVIKLALLVTDLMSSMRRVLARITAKINQENRFSVTATVDMCRSEIATVRDRSRGVGQAAQDAAFEDRELNQLLRELASTVDDATCVRNIVKRAASLLILESDQIKKGHLFRPLPTHGQQDDDVDDGEAPPPETGDGTYRIANLHSLLLDCDRGETP